MACGSLNKDYAQTHPFYHRGSNCPETYLFTQSGEHQASDDLQFSHVINHEQGLPCDDSGLFWITPDSECWETPDGEFWEATPGS